MQSGHKLLGDPGQGIRYPQASVSFLCKMPWTSHFMPLLGQVPTARGPPSYPAMQGLTCQGEVQMSPPWSPLQPSAQGSGPSIPA